MDVVGSGFVLWGKGNFQFDAAAQPATTPVAVADFNGDGILDVAGPSGIALGNGHRNFTRTADTTGFTQGQFLVPMDVLGNGMFDPVIGDGAAEIYASQANGRTNLLGTSLDAIPTRMVDFTTTDIDGDGHSDLLGVMINNKGLVLFSGDGQGVFKRSFQSNIFAEQVVVADFNGDGKPDVIVEKVPGLPGPTIGYLFLHK